MEFRLRVETISSLLDRDPFGSGIVPSDFIRSCTVLFRIAYDSSDSVKDEQTRIKGQTRALRKLKQRSGTITFEIELNIEAALAEQLACIFLQLAFLALFVFELKDIAFNCNITIVSDTTVPDPYQMSIDVSSLSDVPKEELVKKLCDWYTASSKSGRNCDCEEIQITDISKARLSEEDSDNLDMDLADSVAPDWEWVYLRQFLALENDTDYPVLKRILTMIA